MTTPTVDPRVIAEALHMDGTEDLARVLTKWTDEALPTLNFDTKWEPPSMEYFERAVDRSRRLLLSAHEAMDAWYQDNPADDTDERDG